MAVANTLASESPQSTSETKRPLYEASTQYKNWRYSPEQLVVVRASLNAAAVSVIRTTFEVDEVRSFLAPDKTISMYPISLGLRRQCSFWPQTRSISSSNYTSPKYPSYVVTSVSRKR